MDKKTTEIIRILSQDFPNAKSELVFGSPFELLVAVILSAQCTDKRVNQVTPALFAAASTPQQMMNLPIETIETLIHSCGFYHNKAQFLKNASADIVNRFGGEVPSDLESLRTLQGVGRKTANVVYAFGFGGQAIAVDTHVFRVSNRLGIAHAKNVLDTEKQLMQAIDKELWSDCHHYILLHGRYVCKSQNPMCSECHLQSYCEYYKEKHSNADK
ncbi:MAG: endonuclease III [Corallococcus sp.]|nr:endonuclease III [Corallococcus sp.]